MQWIYQVSSRSPLNLRNVKYHARVHLYSLLGGGSVGGGASLEGSIRWSVDPVPWGVVHGPGGQRCRVTRNVVILSSCFTRIQPADNTHVSRTFPVSSLATVQRNFSLSCRGAQRINNLHDDLQRYDWPACFLASSRPACTIISRSIQINIYKSA